MHKKHKKSAIKAKKRRMREKNLANLRKLAEGGGRVEKMACRNRSTDGNDR